MINQEVKGTLAKLLATENLTVEHRKVSTACFDVDRRILVLPIWERASSTVYDLLVGHEVGHALYTPNMDMKGASKAFVNVLEDARIERMMKRTYPGLRETFFKGYRELWEDNFFGVTREELPRIPFIDRINLYFKGNSEVSFTSEEMFYVNRAETTSTFDDVIQLAKDIYEFSQQKQEEKEEDQMNDLPPDPQANVGDDENPAPSDNEVEISSSDDPEEDKEWFTDSDPELDHRSDRSSDDPADLTTPSYEVGNEIGDQQYDETESITEQALKESLETLISDDAREWIYLSTPEVILDNCLISAKDIQTDLYNHFYGQNFTDESAEQYFNQNLEYSMSKYERFKKDAQKSVNYLVKQFEMKKSADEYKRAATSKTGVLDTNKLFKYKLTDDIFKKVTVIPEGKNHGLVMFLDWSGSMQHQLLDTLKQTYNLVWFCKKAGIPFRVYAFQSGHHHEPVDTDRIVMKENVLSFSRDFQLLELFSSRQNRQSLDKSMGLVFTQVFAMNGYRIPYMAKYTLGGTPLAEAVMCSPKLVANLKKLEHVTKVSVICLTDGESNPLQYTKRMDPELDYMNREFNHQYLCHSHGKVFILRDPVTGYAKKISTSAYQTTKEIVSFYREITDFNWVGIRICSKADLTRLVREFAHDEIVSIDKQWKKEKFASIKDKVGFAESFYMPDRGTGMGTLDIEVKQKSEVATKAELARAFKKHMGSKMANKTILNAFIEQIA